MRGHIIVSTILCVYRLELSRETNKQTNPPKTNTKNKQKNLANILS
jgi:hypothetical protein